MGDKDNYPLNNGLPTKQWSINLIVEEDPRSSPMARLLVHSLKLMEAHIAVRNPTSVPDNVTENAYRNYSKVS